MSKRLELIKQICYANDEQIRDMNKVASESRRPMDIENRKRCKFLQEANTHLRKAEYSIVQAKANDSMGDYPKPIKQPILAARCHECGRVYLAMALSYGVDEDSSQNIKDAIANGDELFIAEQVQMQMCKCEKRWG